MISDSFRNMVTENLQRLILTNAERVVNKILSLDEYSCAALSALAGKVIKIEVVNTNFAVFILLSDKQVTLQAEYAEDVDVTIKGTPVTLLALITAGKTGVADVEINGDVSLAQKFQSILRNIDIDWEEYIAQFSGDLTAHKVANLWRNTSHFVKKSGDTMLLNISEYLRYEKGFLPDKSELAEFNQAVDQLRDEVAVLEKRVARLEQHE